MLMQRPASSSFFLLIFHSSTTLSLTETYHFLFPSSLCTCLFGLHLQDNFRVSTLAPSLFLLFTWTSRFHLFLFFSLSALFHGLPCAGLYFFVSTLLIPRKSIIIYYCVSLKVSCKNRYTIELQLFTET